MFNYGNANEAQKEAISATDGLVLMTLSCFYSSKITSHISPISQ